MNDTERAGLIVGAVVLNDQANQRAKSLAAQSHQSALMQGFLSQGMTYEQANVALAQANREAAKDVNPFGSIFWSCVGFVLFGGLALGFGASVWGEIHAPTSAAGHTADEVTIIIMGLLTLVFGVLAYVRYRSTVLGYRWNKHHRVAREFACNQCHTLHTRRPTDPETWNCYACGSGMGFRISEAVSPPRKIGSA